MKKFAVFSGTIFIAILLAGGYGIIHDQITYSISPEYYTKFKYQQFGINAAEVGGDRIAVAFIGFLATWMVGLIIGLVIGFTGLFYTNYIIMKKAITRAFIIIFSITIFLGTIGFIRGRFHLAQKGVSWWLPDNLLDRDDFIVVGSIHNYSYLGGVIGLLIAVIYMIRKKNQSNTAQ